MVDWNNANGTQKRLVQEALLHAYRDPFDMEMLLRLNLDESYAEIVARVANYRVAVFQIIEAAQANGWLDRLIAAARRERSGNPKLAALLPLGDLTGAPPPANRTLEEIVRDDGGFKDVIPWIQGLDRLRRQVCRIESPVNQAVGTGWLVDRDLLLTNWHVVRRMLAGEKAPESIACRFDYAADADGTNPGVIYGLASGWCPSSSPASPRELGTGGEEPTSGHLDYALLRLAEPVGEQDLPSGGKRGWIETKRNVTSPPAGSIIFVLQHPAGDPLKLAIGSSRGPGADATRVLHDANTLNGSSGSPCLNAKLELVALHNAGDPLYDGGIGSPTQNQAVPLEPILANIAASGARNFWAS